MDIFKAIEQLKEERQRIDAVIEHLEALLAGRTGQLTPPRGRRGRKSMGEEERVVVSERMKAYWANKRKIGKARVRSAPETNPPG
ncbi:MAG: hypothetical protein HY820_13570 [Acidobacteria bacterium]|nr:hypothetical protein [Acidobacteriota bacterium]